MQEICKEMEQQIKAMAIEQDVIDWRRLIEGMLSKKDGMHSGGPSVINW